VLLVFSNFYYWSVSVIAHRLSTIKNADVILVVNKGQIFETGTRDELLPVHEASLSHRYWYERVRFLSPTPVRERKFST
jgi:ABC-type transport system involved in cytochrome bd biosynthesis fused ATPase/permease subunit